MDEGEKQIRFRMQTNHESCPFPTGRTDYFLVLECSNGLSSIVSSMANRLIDPSRVATRIKLQQSQATALSGSTQRVPANAVARGGSTRIETLSMLRLSIDPFLHKLTTAVIMAMRNQTGLNMQSIMRRLCFWLSRLTVIGSLPGEIATIAV